MSVVVIDAINKYLFYIESSLYILLLLVLLLWDFALLLRHALSFIACIILLHLQYLVHLLLLLMEVVDVLCLIINLLLYLLQSQPVLFLKRLRILLVLLKYLLWGLLHRLKLFNLNLIQIHSLTRLRNTLLLFLSLHLLKQ